MKTYEEVEIAPPFLTLALDGGEWSASRLYRFNSGERAPGTHWKRRWLGPRAGLDDVEYENLLCYLLKNFPGFILVFNNRFKTNSTKSGPTWEANS
jgi:hypothetical protein